MFPTLVFSLVKPPVMPEREMRQFVMKRRPLSWWKLPSWALLLTIVSRFVPLQSKTQRATTAVITP